MKAAELKCQNLIVKKVCQVEHFKTFRKAIGPELSLSRPKISATDRVPQTDSIFSRGICVHKENYRTSVSGHFNAKKCKQASTF